MAAIVSSISVGMLLGMNDDLAVFSVAFALGANQIVFGNGQVNDPTFLRRHRVQLEGFAQTFDIFGCGDRHQAQLFRPALPITIAVKRHPLPVFLEYPVAKILQSIQDLCVPGKEDRSVLTSELHVLTLWFCSHFKLKFERG